MSLEKVLQGLKDSFPKTKITDEVDSLKQDLLTSAIPMYELLEKEFGTRTFTSKWYERMHKSLKALVSRFNSKNFITPVLKVLKRIEERIGIVEELIEDNFNDEVSVHAMSVKRVNLISFVQACSFFIVYARRLANMTLAIEINACSEDIQNELEDILPVNLEWLKNNFNSFAMIFDTLLNGKGDIKAVVDDLPDLSINRQNIRVIESANKNLDPLGFGFIPVVMNPAYHIGLFLAEWQAYRLRAAIAEKEVLEVRVMNLKLLTQGKNDAKLQKSIKYIEDNRLKPLYKKIATMEEKYA